MALTPGTLERAIVPSQRMEVGVAGVDMKELVEMGEHWHG